MLGKTLERVTLPLQPEGSILSPRESKGKALTPDAALVHFTAPTIHAEFDGTITLELINLGPLDIALYPSMPICQLIIEQVHGTPVQQHQPVSRADEARRTLTGERRQRNRSMSDL